MNWIGNTLYRMRRKWWLIAIFIVGYWLIGDCFFRDRLLIAEGPAPASFRELPGAIGVSLVVPFGNQTFGRYYLLRGGKIVEVGSIPADAKDDSPRLSAPSHIGGLKIHSRDLYQASPNGRFAAVATATEFSAHNTSEWNRTRNLLIFDLSTGKLVTRVDGEVDWDIRAIAWSPDNEYVAATRLKLNWGGCLFEKIGYMSGHPNTMVSYSLDVFDLGGDRVATMDINSRSKSQRTELVWGDKNMPVETVEDRARQREAEQRTRARRAYQ